MFVKEWNFSHLSGCLLNGYFNEQVKKLNSVRFCYGMGARKLELI